MKNLLPFFILVAALVLFSEPVCAQSRKVFERSAENNALFDEKDPTSLVSLLQANVNELRKLPVEPLPDSVYLLLSEQQRDSLFWFLGELTTEPLIEDDPESPNFGNEKMVVNADGTISYIYPPRKKYYFDLNNISRVVALYDSAGAISEIELWKTYNGNWYCTTRIPGPVLSMHGFKIMEEMPADWYEKLIGNRDKGFWEVMRANSIKAWEKVSLTHVDPWAETSGNIAYFPSGDLLTQFYGYRETPYSPTLREIDYFGDSMEVERMNGLFEDVKFAYVKSSNTTPLSTIYGEDSIRQLSDGTYQFVYPEETAYRYYFWLEFEPVVYVVRQFSLAGSIYPSHVDQLYFCLKGEEAKPYVVGEWQPEGPLKSYFEDYPLLNPREMEWYKLLEK